MIRATALLAIGLMTGWATAGTPREELLRLVPDDAGFVVVVQNLRDLSQAPSPFAKTLQRTRLGKALAIEAERSLGDFQKEVTRETGLTWQRLRDDVVGDAVVFIYRPSTDGKPENEETLILIHARDPKAASEIFAHIDARNKKAGKAVRTIEHMGKLYRARDRANGSPEFDYQNGSIIAMGASESLLKQVITADQTANAKRTTRLQVDDAPLVWWLNPRAFDAAMANQAKAAQGDEAAVLNAMLHHWKAIDGVALAFTPHREEIVTLSITGRPEALPTATRHFLQELSKSSALWSAFPADALVVVAGRFAAGPGMQLGAAVLPEPAHAQMQAAAERTLVAALGNDVMSVLPARLGPDWGMCLQTVGDERWPRLTAAVRLSSEENGPPVVPRVLDGLHTLATVLAITYNSQHADRVTLKSEQQGTVAVRYFENEQGFPQGVKPAYGWKDGYLVLASTPVAISQFQSPKGAADSSPTPLIRVSPRGWARLLQSQRATVEAMMVNRTGIAEADARQRVADLAELLQQFDSMDLQVTTAQQRASITLKLRRAD